MANATQNTEFADTTHKRTQTEDDIYDLDDMFLISKALSQKPKIPGTITCRFLAIPINEPYSFSFDMAQYGQILLENRHKLIILVSPGNIDYVEDIRRAWVSKYVTPFAECVLSFDLPKYDKTTTVIIEQVPTITKTNETGDSVSVSGGGDDDDDATRKLATVPNEAGVRDSRVLVRFPRPPTGAGDAVPLRITRRRATSLPCPKAMAQLRKIFWHPSQFLKRDEMH